MPCGWRRPSWVAGSWRAGREIALGFLLQGRVKDTRRPARSFLKEPRTGGSLPAPWASEPLSTLLPREDRDPDTTLLETSGQAWRPPCQHERPDPELIRVSIPKGRDLCANQIQIEVCHSRNGSLSRPPPSSAQGLPCQPWASACTPLFA